MTTSRINRQNLKKEKTTELLKPEQYRASASRIKKIDESPVYLDIFHKLVLAIYKNQWNAPELKHGYMKQNFENDALLPTVFDFLYLARQRHLFTEKQSEHAY